MRPCQKRREEEGKEEGKKEKGKKEGGREGNSGLLVYSSAQDLPSM